MKRDVMIDSSLSAVNADTDEHTCRTVMVKLAFLITKFSLTYKYR